MGSFDQLKLTLWKHVTIRKRQPITVLLEFLWPIVVFFVIASVRHMFPPESRGDCVYRARALPSAGLLPFVQSLVCNLDNQCYDPSSYEEIPSYNNAKIVPLVDQFYPLIQRADVQNVLNELPTTMRLASHAIQALDRPPVRKVLGRSIVVRDVFKDPSTWTTYLVEETSLDARDVRRLLDAVVDVGQLVRALPSHGLVQTICRPDVLGRVLHFPDGEGAEAVAAALCPWVSGGDLPPALIRKLMMSVDVRGLLRRGTIVLHHLGGVDVAAALDGIGDVVDALQDIPILGDLAKASFTGDTEELVDYLQHAVEFFNLLKSLHLDLDFLGEMMDDLERIVGPNEFVSRLKTVGKHIHRLIRWSQTGVLEDPPASGPVVSDVLSDPKDFAGRLRAATNLTEENIGTLMSIRLKPGVFKRVDVCRKLCDEMNVEDVVEFEGTVDTGTLLQLWTVVCSPGNCQTLFKEEFSPAESKSGGHPATTVATIVRDLRDLLSSAAYLGDRLGDTAKKMFPLLDVGWKAGSTALTVAMLPKWTLEDDGFFVGLASVLETLPGYLPKVTRAPALSLLTAYDVSIAVALAAAKKGAEVEKIIFQRLGKDPKIFAEMLSLGPEVLASVADVVTWPDAMQLFVERPGEVHGFLCNDTLVERLLPEDSDGRARTVLKRFFCSVPVAEAVESFASPERRKEFVTMMEKRMLANGEMDEDSAFHARVRSLCLQIWDIVLLVREGFEQSEQWEKFATRLDWAGQNATVASWSEARSALETARYEVVLHAYTSFLGESPEVRTWTGRTERTAARLRVTMNAVSAEALSVPAEFPIALAEYWPSVVRLFLDGLADTEQVRVVASTRSWSEIVCNETALKSVLPVSPSLANGDFAQFFCNLTMLVEKDVLGVNWFEKPFVREIAELENGESNEIDADWKGTWRRHREMLRRYGRLARESLRHADEIQILMKKMEKVFENMNVTNVLRFSVNVITIGLEFIDRQLATLQPWAWKNVKALISVLDMLVRYINTELEKILAENRVETGVLSFNLPTLTQLMKKVVRLFPDFVNALADVSTTRLGDFIGRVFRVARTEGAAPCDGVSLTDVLDFGPTNDVVRDLERFACDQWKNILAELIQYPMMFQMIWKFREANREGKDLVVNWTQASEDLHRLMNNADAMTQFDGAIFPDVEGFSLENADAAIDRFVRAVVVNSTERGLKFGLLIVDALVPLFENVFRKNESVVTNGTSMIALLRGLAAGDFDAEQRGEVAWLTFKAVAKMVDIILSESTRVLHKLEENGVELKNLFGPIAPTAVFDALPDYIETLVRSILQPDLSLILEEFRHDGSVSFEGICDRPNLLRRLVVTPRRLRERDRSVVLDATCRFLGEPFHRFLLDPYVYSWAVDAFDRVTLLWTVEDPRHVIVHFVDVVEGVELLTRRAGDLLGYATNVVASFRGLANEDRWRSVGQALYETVVGAQLNRWDSVLRTDSASLNGNDTVTSRWLAVANAIMSTVGRGLAEANVTGPQTSLPELLTRFPETRKWFRSAEASSVDLFQLAWRVASTDPTELSMWWQSLDPFDVVCDASNSNRSFGVGDSSWSLAFEEAFCDVDLERVLRESDEFPIDSNSTAWTGGSNDDYVRLARTAARLVRDLAAFRTRFPETKLKSMFLDESTWEEAVRRLKPSPKPGSAVREVLGTILEKVLTAERSSDASGWQELESLERTVEAVLSDMDLLRRSLDASVWKTLNTWYLEKPRVLTFVNVLREIPGLIASVVATLLDPPKLRTLFGRLATPGAFCRDPRSDDAFAIPAETTVSYRNVRSLICTTDWGQFSRDVDPFPPTVKNSSAEISPTTLMAKLGEWYRKMVDAADVGLPYLSADYSDLPWTGDVVWRPAIAASERFLSKIKDRDRSIDVALDYASLVDLIPEWSTIEGFLQLPNSQMDVFLKHLALVPGLIGERFPYQALTDATVLAEVTRRMHDGVAEAATISARFSSPMQLKYFEAFPKDASHFCPPVDSSVFENDVKEWTTPDRVFQILCKEPSTRWIDRLRELKIPDENAKSFLENAMTVLPKDSQWFVDSRWRSHVPFDWTTFGRSVRRLDVLCRHPPPDFYPGYAWSAWKPVFLAFGRVLPLMITFSGESLCPTVPWIDYGPFGELVGLVEKQVSLAEEYERLLCDFPRMNLSAIYHRLKNDLDLVETARQARIQFGRISLNSVHEPDGRSTSCPLVFNATALLAETLNELVVDYVENGTRIRKVKECFEGEARAVVVEEIDKYIKLVSKAVPLLNLPNVTSLTNSSDLVPLVETLLEYLQGQVPVYVAIRNILRSNHTLDETSSDWTPFLDGSININRLASTVFEASKLADVFCDRTRLAAFLNPPTHVASDVAIVARLLCEDGDSTGGGLRTAERFLEAVNQTRVTELLSTLRMRSLLSWTTLMAVGSHLGPLGASLTEVKGILGNLDLEEVTANVTLRHVVEIVLPLVYVDSLATLARGLDSVIEILSPAVYGSHFEESLRGMAAGLHAIRRFANVRLRNDTVELRELVRDVSKTMAFLQEMGIPRQAVDLVVDLTLNVSTLLFDRKLSRLEDLFCEMGVASVAFGMTREYDAVYGMYSALCNPDAAKASRLLDHFFDNVDFGRLLRHELRLVMEEVAEKVGVSTEEAYRAILSLMDATQLVPVLTKALDDLRSDGSLLDMIRTLEPDKLAKGEITSSLISATGSMVCGHPIRSFDEYFRLLQSASEKPPEAKDREELRNLATPFCRTLYQQIAYRPAGSVIWGFVKPMLKGKILFAPDNGAVRRIVRETNRTFDDLALWIVKLQRWTKGFAAMGEFVERRLTMMENLLTLPLARSIVVGLAGEEATTTVQNLSATLAAMGHPERFLGAASVLGDGLDCFETDRFVAYDSEEELEAGAKAYHKQGILMAGIVFLNVEEDHRPTRDAGRNSSQLPPHVQYKIRMDIDAVPTTKRLKARFWRSSPEDDFIEHLRYFRGFVEIQDAIDQAIVRTQVGQDVVLPGIVTQQFPAACHWDDDFGYLLRSNIPAVTTLAWIFIIAFFVRELVLDREMMLEQIMHVMGLKMWVHWLSWFIACLVVMLVTNAVGVLILKYGGVFPHSDLSVLFIFFFIFALSSIMFCFLMSVWFTRATVAAITAVLVYLVCYAPFIVVITLESQLTFVPRMLMNLLMSTSFCQGCLYITRFEEQNVGIQWWNAWESPLPRDEMNFAWSCIMMAIDAVLYFVLAAYFGALLRVCRHSDGKLWNVVFWPFLERRFSCRGKTLQLLRDGQGSQDTLKNGSAFLDETKTRDDDARVGISLQNLRKVFRTGHSREKVAVEGLSLDFYEGQITTLLGQNGAGKTTTINMLTGQFPPASGSATIYDRDVVYEFDDIRKDLGVCPQYNVLFDLLTVREHLEFYGRLKGILKRNHLADDVDGMLTAMGLEHRQNELAQNLSGGMRRRLCVAVAFVGGSRTIVLDEPTSGVDPVARRHIWNLIVRYKNQRTILLTTHHLDEADILSDRVAVLHEGKLLCCGSPLELKRRFGSGYHLTVSKNGGDGGSDADSGAISTSSGSDSPAPFNAGSLYSFVHSYVPNVQLVEDQGTELVFCLPYCDDDGAAHAFDGLFVDLEKHQTRLGIGSYGLSCTTLEEVFMNVCLQADAGLPITTQGHEILMLAKKTRLLDRGLLSKESMGRESTPSDLLLSSAARVVHCQDSQTGTDAWLTKTLYHVHYSHLKGFALKRSQFKWLLTKRFHHFRRDWRALITCIVLPCVFVAIAMGFTLIRPPVDPFSPALLLDPSLYGPGANSFFAVDPGSGSDVRRFARTLVESPGVGSPRFRSPESPPETLVERKEDCVCAAADEPVCSGRDVSFRLIRRRINGDDFLYDGSEVDVVRWLTLTSDDFIERRYGGWTFGARTGRPSLPGPEEKVIAWFENKGYHALPSYVNSIGNAFLRGSLALRGVTNDTARYGISTYNHPLHLSKMQLGMDSLLHHVADVGIALVFLVSFSFIPAGFVIYLVKERVEEEKRLQYVSGVGPLLYWSAALFADTLVLCIPVCLSAIIIAIFDLPIYMYGHNFLATLAMLFAFGWATTPLMYVAEKFFKEPSLAAMILFCINIFVGINTTLCTLLMFLFQRNETMGAAVRFLRYAFLAFPQYAFAGGLVDLTKNYVQAEIFLRFGDDTYVDPFGTEILGLNLVVLGVQGVFFFCVNLVFEWMPEVYLWIERRRNPLPSDLPSEDGDVRRERRRVLDDGRRDDPLRVENLYKVYNGVAGKTVAVDRVCLGIPRGECFGLLGINGAGKTTVFRMLTGELRPTHGEVYFGNKRIDAVISHGSRNVGYCPQANALDELLTAEELLSVYAGLRGIPDEDIPLAVYKAVVQFNLQSHARNVTHTYSCGTKRKLCAAIAVMGNPDVVLMDEPTSGMDPSTRRLVWHNVRQITKEKRSVVLTSHSMEECDTLCHRLAIMVNGRFRCLGSPQYLKHKFGDGYTIALRVRDRPDDWSVLYAYIHEAFASSAIKARHCNTVEFLVSKHAASLGDVFSRLESDRHSLGIVDFSVTQTTLDQVFVNFVREQSEDSESEEADEFGGRVNLGLVDDDDDGGLCIRVQGHPRGTPPDALDKDYQVTQF